MGGCRRRCSDMFALPQIYAAIVSNVGHGKLPPFATGRAPVGGDIPLVVILAGLLRPSPRQDLLVRPALRDRQQGLCLSQAETWCAASGRLRPSAVGSKSRRRRLDHDPFWGCSDASRGFTWGTESPKGPCAARPRRCGRGRHVGVHCAGDEPSSSSLERLLLLLLLRLPMLKEFRIEDIEGQHGRIGIASAAFMRS